MNEKEFNDLIFELIQSGRSSEVPALIEQRNKEFWEDDYQKKSRKERVEFWISHIGRQLRWNVESGVSVEGYFEDFNFNYWKILEPDIELIISEVKEKIRY